MTLDQDAVFDKETYQDMFMETCENIAHYFNESFEKNLENDFDMDQPEEDDIDLAD